MPRHIISRGQAPVERPDLVEKLVKELTGAKRRQPVIVEEAIPATGSRHVHVIWDEWKGVPAEQRSQLIIEAYGRAEGADTAENITIAVGVTPHEALALGLLPFVVQPVRRRTDKLGSEDYEKAIEKELPKTLAGREARQLRYATLEDAEDARRRLEQALPGSYWAVVQETGSADEWGVR
jgi:hypothetical protein